MPPRLISCPICHAQIRRVKIIFRKPFNCPACGALLQADPVYYRKAKIIAGLISATLAFFARNHIFLFVISIASYPFLTAAVATVYRFRASPKLLKAD